MSDTILSRLHRWAEERPDRKAYTFLGDGDEESGVLTYADLERETAAVAAQVAVHAQAGDRALLIAPDGEAFIRGFLGCLRAGVIPVPAYPPFPLRSARRIETLTAIVRDSSPVVAMASGGQGMIDAVRGVIPNLENTTWLDLSAPAEPGTFAEVTPALGDVAFLQYTSGSTSLPKGVMVTHGSLAHNERMVEACFGMSGDETIVGWLPLFHDMGLIGNTLQTLWRGDRAVLMPPLAFIQGPYRWLKAISRYRGTVAGGPNFGYELCVRRVPEDQREGLDLSSWRLAYNGAEPVRAATLDAFAREYAPYGFDASALYPCYGLAEVTLIATGGLSEAPAERLAVDRDELENGRVVEGGSHVLVSSGFARLDREVAIVDPETLARARDGRVGEIWLRGDDVTSGYWEKPDVTEATFGAHIADTGEGPWLRTGDLGFLRDGELYVTGRLKELIIIRGRNLYPHDLELTVEGAHPAVRNGCSAAFAVEAATGERLVIVCEVKQGEAAADPAEIERAARAAVNRDHAVKLADLVLVAPQAVPKTSSGKLQRHACRAMYERGELERIGGGADAAADQDTEVIA